MIKTQKYLIKQDKCLNMNKKICQDHEKANPLVKDPNSSSSVVPFEAAYDPDPRQRPLLAPPTDAQKL